MSKPKQEYNTDEYFELDLKVAPTVMVGDEILVEGSDVSEKELEANIRRHWGWSPQKLKVLLGKLFKRSKGN